MALSYNLGYQEIISVHPTRRQIFAGKTDSTFLNIWQWVISGAVVDRISKTVMTHFSTRAQEMIAPLKRNWCWCFASQDSKDSLGIPPGGFQADAGRHLQWLGVAGRLFQDGVTLWVIKSDFLSTLIQLDCVLTHYIHFMILMFSFILYYWRFLNTSSEYFRPRRALVKDWTW